YLLAVGTLREVTERPGDALTDRGVKVSRAEVQAVIERTVGGVDAEELARIREVIQRRALHAE
ncbi:MAG: farnesyl-diphosphate farnesyltransferase, partial [Candidatus Nanohaloarchaea archaeon]